MRFHGVMAMVLVHDIDRATRFYRDVLGFTIQEESEDWVMFNEGVGLQVSPEPLPEHSASINAVQVALSVENVHESYDELIKRGIPFYLPPMESGGMLFATFRDTEGNLIQLVEMQ
ncbi:MAG TPA: VOC family protein [Chthonomonadaceae bacterium]|nr:VOC family protein [Chthonomonadaceae bacterium]